MNVPARRPHDLVYVIGTYPLLTTTFVDREITSMLRDGLDVGIISLRRPGTELAETQQALAARTTYLLPTRARTVVGAHVRVVGRHPLRFLALLVDLLRREHPGFRARLRTLLHVAEGVCVADLVRRHHPTSRLHAHFLDRATLVALVVGRLLRIPYSATGHASELYVDPVLLREKIGGATRVMTCTQYNARHLSRLARPTDRHKIHCVHHGLDVASYEPDDRGRAWPPMILSVGQLCERKGFPDLLRACRELRDRGHAFTLEVVGDGPQRGELRAMAAELAIDDLVRWHGALPWTAVVDRYREASVFTLACVTGDDGDRDGIPNVILEAMAMALPVVSTDHSGIPEAVLHEVTGLLVPPRRPEDLADALELLLHDRERADELGRRGRERILEAFDVEVNVRRFRERISA